MTNFPLGVLARRTARPVPTVHRLQGVTALSMRIFTHSISPGRSRLERRRVQPPRSVQVRAEKLFQLDLINRQGTAACCALRTAGVDGLCGKTRKMIGRENLDFARRTSSAQIIVTMRRMGGPRVARSPARPRALSNFSSRRPMAVQIVIDAKNRVFPHNRREAAIAIAVVEISLEESITKAEIEVANNSRPTPSSAPAARQRRHC